MEKRNTILNILEIAWKIFLKFTWCLIVIPLVICVIPFIIIGWLGIDQITRCIAEKSQKRRY